MIERLDETLELPHALDGQRCACGKRVISAEDPKLEKLPGECTRRTDSQDGKVTVFTRSCPVRCLVCQHVEKANTSQAVTTVALEQAAG